MARRRIAGAEQFVVGFESNPVWVGIDVHKRSYAMALLRADQRIHTWSSPASPEAVVDQLQRLRVPVAAVAYEAGPTGSSLARALQQAGLPVLVVAPSRVPRPVRAGAKCDRLDCLKLAQFAARGMLRPIAVPTVQEEARRSLVRRRHDLVDAIRRVKQRIKSHLLFLGLPEPQEARNWSARAAEALRAIPMDAAAHLTLESHLRELSFHQHELRTVAQQLQHVVHATDPHRQRMECLQSVPGVGPTVAATFALELYRPERFERGEQVASDLGLAPMVRHRGGQTPSGRIVPVGQTRLRSLLIEAAWMWKARDPHAAAVYQRLVGRCGIAQKAITALARRLAILLWRLAIELRPYRVQPVMSA